MITIQMTKERKYILVAGLLLLLVGVVYRLYPMVQAALPDEEQLALRQAKLQKYARKVENKKTLAAAVATLERRVQRSEADLMAAKTPALAAADLQKTLRQISDRAGAEIKTMRVLTPSGDKEGYYVPIPVEVTVYSSIRQLMAILHGIESSRKLLRISNVTLRATRVRKTETIIATFKIEGFMRPQTG